MEKPRVLSGEALVAKGITKIDASLPEVGLKDVIPNNSWLEQKQIQAALEARKHLIEVERVEKCGTLSHAEWRDDLMLAEVTQKAGGYWQYLGHNVGKTLYLRPEEALFLMEVNCLLLKHNEVTVSLQKAYSLLQSSSTTMIQYKVYASLSRLGYRVFRHTGPKLNDEKNTYSQKFNKVHGLKNVDSPKSPTVEMDHEFKDVDSPTGDTSKSECVDASIVSTGNEIENFYSCKVSPLTNSENVVSPIVSIVKESEHIDPSEVNTAVEPHVAESNTQIDNTVCNSKSNNSPILIDSVIVKNSVNLPIGSQASKLSENEQKQISSPEEFKHSETNENIVEMSEVKEIETNENIIEKGDDKDIKTNQNIVEIGEVKDIETNKNIVEIGQDKVIETNKNIVETGEVKDIGEVTEQYDAENSVAKENESPNIMEIDLATELKNPDNKIETVQEVSSTTVDSTINLENKIDSMEICTENQEDIGIVLMEVSDDRSKDVEAISAEEPNTMISSDVPIDLGTQTIEDSTKCPDDVLYKHNLNYSNKCTSTESITQNIYCSNDNDSYNYLSKIEKITKRQLKPSASKSMEKYFKNVPDFSKDRVVTVSAPEQQFIPINIFVNKANYLLNLQNIKLRSFRSASSESPAYTSSDEVNGTNIRRIRSSSEVLSTELPQNSNFFPLGRFPRFQHFRPYGFWRPQNNLNFYQLMFFQTRVQYNQRPQLFLRPTCFNINSNDLNISKNARKRMRTGKSSHLQGIKNLAVRLKQSLISGNTDMQNLETLHGLLHTYNSRYKSRLRLTEHFDVVNEEKIVETIELDDDEESKSKKPRLEKDNDDKFDENLYRLRQFASRLRDLETKDKATASHRRAFSKAIKTFNKSYNADIYLNYDNYEVIDRRCITLDSSSESDCVVEEQPQVRSKKLKNPFNILKRRSERMQSLNNPGTSKNDNSSDTRKTDTGPTEEANKDNDKYSELILTTFSDTWLPNEKDFGRAEIVPKRFMNSRLMLSHKEQFLFEYMKDQFQHYQNWPEAKISFLRYLEETNTAFKSEQARILADSELCNTGLKPLIDFEGSSDMPSVLEKLRITKNNKDIEANTSLRVDFDVYNRNVQNFRKRNPPKPHFRMICIEESSTVPSAADVMSLHSKYEDNVPIVFAIVSTGSISYLQINPIDLPIYVPSNDVV